MVFALARRMVPGLSIAGQGAGYHLGHLREHGADRYGGGGLLR